VITYVIPSIPRRADMLGQAVRSVAEQTVGCQMVVELDHLRRGAWHTRNAGIRKALAQSASGDLIGFLDDDDYLLPHHTETLIRVIAEQDAILAYSWFEVEGGTDPFPQHRGRRYDPADPHIFPITYLVRADMLSRAMERCGGFQEDTGYGTWEAQDHPVIDALWYVSGGGRFGCTDEITWVWRHHGSNTSGMPNR